MTVGQEGPAVAKLRLRTDLRALREQRGLSHDQVADEMVWSTSKVARIESGAVTIAVNDLRALLRLYEVEEAAKVDGYVDLAIKARRQRVPWSRYRPYVSKDYLDYIGYEAEASVIRHNHSVVVPGLFQTQDYAAALSDGMSLREPSSDFKEARVQIRMARQADILEREDPPDVHVILDEAVLHRPIGNARIMSEQFAWLKELHGRSNISLSILPFSVGAHPGLHGPFTLIEFVDPRDPDVLYIEGASGDTVVRDDDKLIGDYRQAFERLLQMSRHGKDAIELIDRAQQALS
jgi:transcriptional regulator with XRE-family HTH domain